MTTPEPEPEPEPEPVVQPVLLPSCGSPSPSSSTSTHVFAPPLPSPAGWHARITPVPGSVETGSIWPRVAVFRTTGARDDGEEGERKNLGKAHADR